MANLVGFVVLTVLTSIFLYLLPESVIAHELTIFVFLFWSIFAWYVWNDRRAPETPKKWFFIAFCTLVAAPLFYGFAIIVAAIAFGGNEPTSSAKIDLFLAMTIAPGFTFIAIAGGMRAIFKGRKVE